MAFQTATHCQPCRITARVLRERQPKCEVKSQKLKHRKSGGAVALLHWRSRRRPAHCARALAPPPTQAHADRKLALVLQEDCRYL